MMMLEFGQNVTYQTRDRADVNESHDPSLSSPT